VGDGTHNIIVYAIDNAGNIGSAEVWFTVNTTVPNTPPNAIITAPSTGSSYISGTLINFTGLATDAETANNTLSVTWTSNISGLLNNNPPDVNGSVGFSTSALPVGVHNITLTVTDSGGLTDTDSIVIEITALPPIYGVDIWAVPTSQTVVPGQSANYTIYINNTGSTVNTYNITFNNINGADSVQLSQSQITLNAGQTGTITLIVMANNPGLYTVNVTAIDADNSSVTDTVSTITNVTAVPPTDTGWIYNSTVNGTFYVNQSTEIFPNINNTLINKSTVNSQISDEFGAEMHIVGSTIINSTIIDLAGDSYAGPDVYIVNCTIINSTKIEPYCENSVIINANDPRSNTIGSNITNTPYNNSNITYSIVDRSYIDWSDINYSIIKICSIRNSTVDHSTAEICNLYLSRIINSNLSNVNATNSVVINSTLANVSLYDAWIENGTLINGTICGINWCSNETGMNVTDPSEIPSISLSANPTSGYAPLTVTFTATVSGMTPSSYTWNFGDGNTTTNGNTTSHTYTSPAVYTARLEVSNSNKTAWAQINITVNRKGGYGGYTGGGWYIRTETTNVTNVTNITNVTNQTTPTPTSTPTPAPTGQPSISIGPVCGDGVCEPNEDCSADCQAGAQPGIGGLIGLIIANPAGIAGIGGFIVGIVAVFGAAKARKMIKSKKEKPSNNKSTRVREAKEIRKKIR
ncbi:MAG: PKD domain-containing protein, partial [Candidatus Aenigmatarchaeota archaeon]